ncbi:MAG: BMP family protein [Microbacteriaceae bacterium]
MRITRSILSAALVLAATTGCAPINEEATVTPVDYKACLAADQSFIEAGSVSDQALEGLQRSVLADGLTYKISLAPKNATTPSFLVQLKEQIAQGCDLVIATTYRMSNAVYRVAKANPDTNFLLVDAALTNSRGSEVALPNVKQIAFSAGESALLAGYLAAAQSKSEIVGAVGGAKVASVQNALLAFKQGVDLFNDKTGTSVKVAGIADENPLAWKYTERWASASQQSLAALELLGEGADVVYLATGSTTFDRELKTSENYDVNTLLLIGSDFDWYALPQNESAQPLMLASTTKNIAGQVAAALADAVAGEFAGGQSGAYLGNLANGGVTLTEPHDVDYAASVRSALNSLTEQIASGALVVDSLQNNK